MNDWKMSLPGISVVKHAHSCLKFLMDNAVASSTLNQRDSKGMTVLHHACQNPTAASLSTVQALLAKGVDPNILDMSQKTALHLLCEYKRPADKSAGGGGGGTPAAKPLSLDDDLLVDMARSLVNGGADINLGHDGKTALTAALENNHHAISSFFLCESQGLASSAENDVAVIVRIICLGLTRDVKQLWDAVTKSLGKASAKAALRYHDAAGMTPLHRLGAAYVKARADASGDAAGRLLERMIKLVASCLKLGAEVNARVEVEVKAGAQSTDKGKGKEPVTPGYNAKTKVYTRRPEHDVSHGGQTLLHLVSADGGSGPLVQMLLKQGADHGVADGFGETALFQALRGARTSTAVVRELTKAGADVNVQSARSGDSPVMTAVASGSSIAELVEKGGDVNMANWLGKTPLLVAVGPGSSLDDAAREALVKALLVSGADPCAMDADGASALHLSLMVSKAAANSSFAVERLLVSHGADLRAVDKNGRSLLHIAFVDLGDKPSRGEEPEPETRRWGQAPAETSRDPIELVSDMCALDGLVVDHVDKYGWSPLHYAARCGAIISTRYLLQRGADINRPNGDGNTPLQLALLGRHVNYSVTLITDAIDPSREVAVVDAEAKTPR